MYTSIDYLKNVQQWEIMENVEVAKHLVIQIGGNIFKVWKVQHRGFCKIKKYKGKLIWRIHDYKMRYF